MASYTAQQLSGAGTPIEAISGQKTFTLTKPSNLSGSAYFTIETVKNSSGNFIGFAKFSTFGCKMIKKGCLSTLFIWFKN